MFFHENFANHLMFLSEKLTYSHQQHTFFFKNDFLNQKCVRNYICKDDHQIGSFIGKHMETNIKGMNEFVVHKK